MQAKIFFLSFTLARVLGTYSKGKGGGNKERVQDDGFKIVVVTLEAKPGSRFPLHQINQLELEVCVGGRGGAGARKLQTHNHVTPTKVELELELGCDNNIDLKKKI